MIKFVKKVIDKFFKKDESKITGTISTFDRMIFKGHIIPFFIKDQRHYFLSQENILIKDFKPYALKISKKVKDHGINLANKEERPYKYLNSSRESKENIAKEIMEKDKIEKGLICVLSCVEPCISFAVEYNQDVKKLEIITKERKCQFLYFYYNDSNFGFMHVRIQTWFPFQIQIYMNGRHWLMKQLDKKNIGYEVRPEAG